MHMLTSRTPTPPRRRFETKFGRNQRDIAALKRQANRFVPDAFGRFRIGDVFIIQEPQDDGTIRVSLQNAVTGGPPHIIGDLA